VAPQATARRHDSLEAPAPRPGVAIAANVSEDHCNLAGRTNGPDEMVYPDGSVYRLVSDSIGSVRLVVNVATGAVGSSPLA